MGVASVLWIYAHGDVDGITSAAMIKHLHRDAEVFFTHPHGLYGDIVHNVAGGDELFILDIALDEITWKRVMKLLEVYSTEGRVVYVDHHILPRSFIKPSFEFYHDTRMSTAELTYRIYSGKLGIDMSRVALYGAVGDYSDETEYVKQLYDYWDKRFVYLESGILAQGLEASRKMYGFKREIVDQLSNNELPSDNKELVDRAIEITVKEESMRTYVFKNKKVLECISYILEPEGSLGRAARYAYVYGDRDVGVAIELRGDIAVLSLRSKKNVLNIDLNQLLREVTPKFGGSGGGHRFAAGARVPRDKLDRFLMEIDGELKKVISTS